MGAHNTNYIKDRLRHVFTLPTPSPQVSVYEGKVTAPDTAHPFEIWNDLTLNEYLSRIDFFEANCQGFFTFFIRSKKTDQFQNAQRIFVQNGDESFTPGRSSSSSSSVNIEKMIEERVNSALAKMSLEAENKRLKEELEEAQSAEANWVLLAEKAMMHFGMKTTPIKTAINGNPTQSAPVQGVQFTPEQKDALEISCGILVDSLGEENVHKMALICTDKPELLNQFKMMLENIPVE